MEERFENKSIWDASALEVLHIKQSSSLSKKNFLFVQSAAVEVALQTYSCSTRSESVACGMGHAPSTTPKAPSMLLPCPRHAGGKDQADVVMHSCDKLSSKASSLVLVDFKDFLWLVLVYDGICSKYYTVHTVKSTSLYYPALFQLGGSL